jgi:metal-dependent amidase/aminoacylase/carboxypeptidase family protein
VISFGSFQGGKPGGTFVGSSELRGLARWFEPEVRDTMHRRIINISEGIAESYGAAAMVAFRNLYPAVVNHPAETALAVEVARNLLVFRDKVLATGNHWGCGPPNGVKRPARPAVSCRLRPCPAPPAKRSL